MPPSSSFSDFYYCSSSPLYSFPLSPPLLSSHFLFPFRATLPLFSIIFSYILFFFFLYPPLFPYSSSSSSSSSYFPLISFSCYPSSTFKSFLIFPFPLISISYFPPSLFLFLLFSTFSSPSSDPSRFFFLSSSSFLPFLLPFFHLFLSLPPTLSISFLIFFLFFFLLLFPHPPFFFLFSFSSSSSSFFPLPSLLFSFVFSFFSSAIPSHSNSPGTVQVCLRHPGGAPALRFHVLSLQRPPRRSQGKVREKSGEQN